MPRELRALEHGSAGRGMNRAAVRRLLDVFWVQAEPALRLRIVATVAVLSATALINALVPLLFAGAIDALDPRTAALAAPLRS